MIRRLVSVLGGLVLLASCAGARPVSEIAIGLSEFDIDLSHSLAAGGELTLELANVGELPHTIVISAADGKVVAASDAIQSETTSTFSVTLEPGEYEFTCRIVAEFDGVLLDHFELGMVESVTVSG